MLNRYVTAIPNENSIYYEHELESMTFIGTKAIKLKLDEAY